MAPSATLLPNIEYKDEYISLLCRMANLSRLFSDSDIPYLHYRVMENVFCRYLGADNLSRSDTAFDARQDKIGIGLKTFTMPQNSSLEKVAEFNSRAHILQGLKGEALAREVSLYRNERIRVASELYGISQSIYHIVGRREGKLLLFNTDYEPINIDTIGNVKNTKAGISFDDGAGEYSFNRSKSTLFKRFHLPSNPKELPVSIWEDPYKYLLGGIFSEGTLDNGSTQTYPFVILPLYSTRTGLVPERSGLNQWNAGGRKRDYGEVYIPIPQKVHSISNGFFPPRDQSFELEIPNGEVFQAKVCQENSKALMTNPNNKLSSWLLRGVFALKEGELLTSDRLALLGVNCLIVYKLGKLYYKIDVAPWNEYEIFIQQTQFAR